MVDNIIKGTTTTLTTPLVNIKLLYTGVTMATDDAVHKILVHRCNNGNR